MQKFVHLVRRDLDLLRAMVQDRRITLHEIGIPKTILDQLASDPASAISADWQQKYVEAIEYIEENKTRGVILIGNDSVEKDTFAAALLLSFLDLKQRIRFIVSPSLTDPLFAPIYAVAFMGMDLPGLHAHYVKNYVRQNLLFGRMTILSGLSIESMEETMTPQVISYLTSKSIIIDLSTPRAKMPTF